VNGFMLPAVCAVAKPKAMYALLPRYCVYPSLEENICLVNECMSELISCGKG